MTWTEQELKDCMTEYMQRHPGEDLTGVVWSRQLVNYRARKAYQVRREEIIARRHALELKHRAQIDQVATAILTKGV